MGNSAQQEAILTPEQQISTNKPNSKLKAKANAKTPLHHYHLTFFVRRNDDR